MNAVIPRATVTQIVAQRDRALSLYGKAHDAVAAASAALVEANKAARQSAAGGMTRYNCHSTNDRRSFLAPIEVPDREEFMKEARRLTDIDVWSHVITITDLERLMDKKAKDQLGQDLVRDPPEVTVDNIAATLEKFILDAGTIWRRGIAEAFVKLDRRFRSHDGWKIGSRVILTRAFDENGYWNYRSNERDTLQDIERVFKVLDEKPIPTVHGGIIGAVDEARRSGWGARQTEIEAEYFKLRVFKNGNVHLWFKRDELVDKVNKLLGEYYDAPIPEDREADEDTGLHNPKTSLAKNYGFYPTPQDTTERLIDAVPLYNRDDTKLFTVLEPSAGTGNLTKALAAKGAIVDAVEIHAYRVMELRVSGSCRKVVQSDFLLLEPTELYDRVVMNPPFDRERDIDHVVHAMKFLKPDGCLVTIMSAGTEFRETRKSIAFREMMGKLNAKWRDLPAGSFASVGTYCNTIMLRVWRDGRDASWR